MKYAYPQNPSAAISTIRRFDETSDALTQQSDLDRKQSVALIGETVPLVFCERGDWGNGQGENGGVWLSPKLVQLGLEGERLSMMYLLSQGKVGGVTADNVFWGQEKLLVADDSANFCTAYQNVPACLKLDYEPGAELGWNQTVIKSGPEGEGTIVTEENCNKISVTWESIINVKGSGTVVGGYAGKLGIYDRSKSFSTYDCEVSSASYGLNKSEGFDSSFAWNVSIGNQMFLTSYGRSIATEGSCERLAGSGSCPIDGGGFMSNYYMRRLELCRYGWDMRKHHLQTSWEQESEVFLYWTLTKVDDGSVVDTGGIWVRNGSTSLTIDGLEPDVYQLQFFDMYVERNKPYDQTVIPDPNGNMSTFWTLYQGTYPTTGPSNGFQRHTNPGDETREITSIVTQNLYTEFVLPDLPGGQTQVVGGLNDLTMGGIEGNILNLRPFGIDRFLQSHIFVEYGIEVYRLIDRTFAASRLYSDLVYHLMGTSKILQPDQIDIPALTASAKMNQNYSLFFNGILQTTNSLSEWMTRTAPYFLLSLRQVNGKYGLFPVCPLGSDNRFQLTPIEPSLVITADQILEGSYSRSYFSNKDRRPICLVMVYRDQPTQQIGQTVTVEARYPGTAELGPYEQHDLTEFCCRGEHAVYAARYILAKRRHTTHSCQLTIGREGQAIAPGDIVQVDLKLLTSNGNGITDAIMYQVESVNEGQEGTVQLELMHFPVDSSGVSMVAKEIESGAISIT